MARVHPPSRSFPPSPRSPARRRSSSSPPSTKLETVIVTGERTQADLPNKIEGITAVQAQTQINAVNTEDMLKYIPSIVVRKRHYGDTQDPLATRTSGVGASARSLLFVDGILISSPIGNNNTSASPAFRHRRAAGHQEFRSDLWPLRRRICRRLDRRGAQHHHPHARSFGDLCRRAGRGAGLSANTPPTAPSVPGRSSGGIGDRYGAFSWRLSANHLDSTGQPLAYVTLTRPATTSAAGTPVTGAFNDLNRTGAADRGDRRGGIEHQVQDTDTLKLAYDFANGMASDLYRQPVPPERQCRRAKPICAMPRGTPVYAGNSNIGGYQLQHRRQHLLQQCLSTGSRPIWPRR